MYSAMLHLLSDNSSTMQKNNKKNQNVQQYYSKMVLNELIQKEIVILDLLK